jgi:hypothetical protein
MSHGNQECLYLETEGVALLSLLSSLSPCPLEDVWYYC